MSLLVLKFLKKHWKLAGIVGVACSMLFLVILFAPIASFFQIASVFWEDTSDIILDSESAQEAILEKTGEFSEENMQKILQEGTVVHPEKFSEYFEAERESIPENQWKKGKVWKRITDKKEEKYYANPSGPYGEFEYLYPLGDITYPYRLWWHAIMGLDILFQTSSSLDQKGIDQAKDGVSPQFTWSEGERWVYISDLVVTEVYVEGILVETIEEQTDTTYNYPRPLLDEARTMFKDYIFQYEKQTTSETGWEEMYRQEFHSIEYELDFNGEHVYIDGSYEPRNGDNAYYPAEYSNSFLGGYVYENGRYRPYDSRIDQGKPRYIKSGGGERDRYREVSIDTVVTTYQRTKVDEDLLVHMEEVPNMRMASFFNDHKMNLDTDPYVIYAVSQGFPDSHEFVTQLQQYMGIQNFFTGGYIPLDIKAMFIEAEEQLGIPWWFLASIGRHESGGTFDPGITNGRTGDEECIGIMQVNYNLHKDLLEAQFGVGSLNNIRNDPRMQILTGSYILKRYLNRGMGNEDYDQDPGIDWNVDDRWRQDTLDGLVYYGGWLTKGPMSVARILCTDRYAGKVWNYAIQFRDEAGMWEAEIDPSELLRDIPRFYQTNYGDKNNPDHRYGPGTIRTDGCGPTSMAMVVTGLLKNTENIRSIDLNKDGILDPIEATAYAKKHGYYVYIDGRGVGTSWAYFNKIGSEVGLRVQQVDPSSHKKVIEELQKGNPVIASMKGPGDFVRSVNGGHFIVLVGIDSNGNVIVNDPASREISERRYGFYNSSSGQQKPILIQAKQFFIVSRDM